ncbi:alpha/beta hydrolase [Pseudomonas sp.]|uniref:alpha/beta fold hydrolase n=1 Tax=Pseudomonas sp. TaxID=306 RepID=UPI0028AF6B70|nr:alpha/beta hydrolase [Pseudomonas sp.]
MHLIPWSYPTVEGFTLRGWRSPPSGKPLLHMLHGNGFCALVYRPMLFALSERFDLWLSDVQGHGESDHGGVFRGWNRSAELALEAFEAGRAVYGQVPRYAVGHSFGGVLTALILAQRPALFERAVLLDPVLFSRRMIATFWVARRLGLHRRHGLARKAAGRRSQWPDRQTARAALQGRGIFKGWTPQALEAYLEHALMACPQGVQLRCRPAREAEIFSSMPRRLWPSLKRIAVPTLILHGDGSYPFVGPSVRRAASFNRMLAQQQVSGGHCFMQEAPDIAAERVIAFLSAGSLG